MIQMGLYLGKQKRSFVEPCSQINHKMDPCMCMLAAYLIILSNVVSIRINAESILDRPYPLQEEVERLFITQHAESHILWVRTKQSPTSRHDPMSSQEALQVLNVPTVALQPCKGCSQ